MTWRRTSLRSANKLKKGESMRRFFWFLNKFFMVPMFRLGFGPIFGNPFSGYIMVLKVVGRKTGRLRYAPVNYAIFGGKIYCISGYRQGSDWYRNLRAQPAIEVIMPAGAIAGMATEITAPALRTTIIRKVLQNAGFAGFFEGYNPFRISDEELARKTADMPLICIQPNGLGSGASDPAGWAWILTAISIVLLVLVLRLILR
jgi:deazaflavin-dependent oxidoreductase (nitroreductase family)